MRVIKWVIVSILVTALIFGALQGFWLRQSVSEQGTTLTDIQQRLDKLSKTTKSEVNRQSVSEQSTILTDTQQDLDELSKTIKDEVNRLVVSTSDFSIIMDTGVNTYPMFHTNARGTTAITNSDYTIGSWLHLYVIERNTYPKLLVDFKKINPSLKYISYPFVTKMNTVLVPVGFSPGLQFYRVTLDGEATLVFNAVDAVGGIYFAGEDSRTGAIYHHYRTKDSKEVIIKSTDDGKTWTKIYEQADPKPRIYEIAAFFDRIFVVFAEDRKVLFSADGGATWKLVLDKPDGYTLEGVIITSRGEVFVSGAYGKIYYSPSFATPYDWYEIRMPPSYDYLFRQLKPIGRYIVTNGLSRHVGTAMIATPDYFHTVGLLYTIPQNDELRYSGIEDTLYFGIRHGMVAKAKLPKVLLMRVALPRQILVKDSIAPGELVSSIPFEAGVALSSSFSLTVSATYHASATQGIRVHLYTSYDGGSWDTVELKDSSGNPIFGDMPFVAGQTHQKTKVIPSNARFIKVTVENVDANYALRNVEVVAAVGG